ncbi:zinc finger protein OZF-like [Diorhabda carinulata]|uniref:zinc finger protein OZF-like n=1 Tax=Diorhabda carinulata TaxID=1163345 RepID=UPI0025A046C2|nr:zinc finger protein OZF-like [Diorhabda carinulata]
MLNVWLILRLGNECLLYSTVIVFSYGSEFIVIEIKSKFFTLKKFTYTVIALIKINQMNDQEKVNSWECIVCFESFKLNSDLTDHLRRHIGIQSFTCSVCFESFTEKNLLIQHIDTHNKVSRDISQSKSIVNSDLIDTSEEAELLQNIDKIIDEKIRYSQIENINQDNDSSDIEVETFSQCTLCAKEFSSTVELAAHLQKHIKLKPFDCTTCLVSFSNKNQLLKHVKVCEEIPESGNKNLGLNNKKLKKCNGKKCHICNICERQFASNTNLRKHLRYHIGEIKYVCSYCEKGFVQGHALRTHLRKHTGEKPYQCEICSKSFSSKSNRDNHVMAHNNQYKFKCEKCDKTFIKKINYKSHLKKHYHVKLHSCKICLKSFYTKNSLNQHILGHRKQNMLECPMCSSTFKTKSSFKQHMELQHENQTEKSTKEA